MALGLSMSLSGTLKMDPSTGIDIAWLADQFDDLVGLELKGVGGQRWTFKCNHPSHGDCALKVIKPGREGRLDRELEAISRIPECPNIPVPFSVGSINSPIGPLVWILEQFIDGQPLNRIIDGGILSCSEALRLGQDLLAVVSMAEAENVVHRDIKPENIIVDAEGKTWLLDFGITRVLDLESRTRSDALMGPHSPGYGAPEQFRNRKSEIDGRSDLFGIGVVLYEAVTGRNPFREGATDRAEILNRVETNELPPLDLDWDPNKLFAAFIVALTQKYPHQRPRSCAEAKDWFDEIVIEIGD
jgi:serine/threonine protein kinase